MHRLRNSIKRFTVLFLLAHGTVAVLAARQADSIPTAKVQTLMMQRNNRS